MWEENPGYNIVTCSITEASKVCEKYLKEAQSVNGGEFWVVREVTVQRSSLVFSPLNSW